MIEILQKTWEKVQDINYIMLDAMIFNTESDITISFYCLKTTQQSECLHSADSPRF